MNWSEQAWQSIGPVYEAITGMPFIRELSEGTLDLRKFRFYITQDAIYLDRFGRVLALIGARAPSTGDSLAFIRFAEQAIVVENALHASYVKELGIADRGVAEPACHHYTSYLAAVAALDYVEVAMAAVLPCFWIYKAVGSHIVRNRVAGPHPFQQWIDTYESPEFGRAVEEAIHLCNRAADNATEAVRKNMIEAFVTASRLEFDFWDAAYRFRKW
jgi:thiaminase/transcriptional activator TenA